MANNPHPSDLHVFAASALQGLVANPTIYKAMINNEVRQGGPNRYEQVASLCYQMAQAMMDEGNNQP